MIKRVLCFENPARLSLKLAQMVVELQDVTRTLPIEDIGVVILDHKQITITHAVAFGCIWLGLIFFTISQLRRI